MNQVVRQVHRTVTSPRRFGFVSLAVLVGVALYFVAAFPVVRNAASVVKYQSTNDVWTVIEPVDSVLCPGETMNYSVDIGITSAPAVIDIYESWCIAGRQCPREFRLPPDFSIASKSGELGSFDARRVLPNLPPGEWEFRHANISKANQDQHSLSGYSLFVTVPTDCAQ